MKNQPTPPLLITNYISPTSIKKDSRIVNSNQPKNSQYFKMLMIILILVKQTTQKFTYLTSFTIKDDQNMTPFSYKCDYATTNLICSVVNNANSKILLYYAQITYLGGGIFINNLLLTDGFLPSALNTKYRTNDINNSTVGFINYLQFTQDFCHQNNRTGPNTTFTSMNKSQIKQCLYAQNNTNILLLTANTTTNTYMLYRIQNNIYTGMLQIPSITLSTNFYKSLYKSGYLYLQFATAIYVYRVIPSFAYVRKYIFDALTSKPVSFSVQNNYFYYCQVQDIYVYNVTSNYEVLDDRYREPIIDSLIYYPLYLIVLTSTKICQYQFQKEYCVANIYLNFTATSLSKIIMISGNYLFVDIGNSTILTYLLDLTPTTPPPINPNNTNNTNNTSNNLLNSSDDNLNSIQNVQINWTIVFQNSGKVLSFFPTNFISKVAIAYVIFLDDLQYYQYHRTNYSESIKFVMNSACAINDFRLTPWYLQQLLQYRTVSFINQDQKYKNLLPRNDDGGQFQVYFLCSSQSIFIGNLVLCANLYFSIKIIHFLFYLFSKIFDKSAIIALINGWLKKNTKWWTFPVSFIESNMITIIFKAFTQLKPNQTSFWAFENKLNLISTIVVLFILTTYAFCFYPLAYRYISRPAAKTLLNFGVFQLGGFLVQSFCRIVRNFVKGFIQSYYIEDYKTQLICLIASDILFIIVSVYLNKSLKQKKIRCLYNSYYILFLIFDLMLYIYYFSPQKQSSQTWLNYENFNKITFIILAIMIIIVTLQSVYKFYLNIKEIRSKYIKIKNKMIMQANTELQKQQNNSNQINNSNIASEILEQNPHIFINAEKIIKKQQKRKYQFYEQYFQINSRKKVCVSKNRNKYKNLQQNLHLNYDFKQPKKKLKKQNSNSKSGQKSNLSKKNNHRIFRFRQQLNANNVNHKNILQIVYVTKDE